MTNHELIPEMPEDWDNNTDDVNADRIPPFIYQPGSITPEELQRQKTLQPYRDDSNSISQEDYRILVGLDEVESNEENI